MPGSQQHGGGSHCSVAIIVGHVELPHEPVQKVCAGFKHRLWYAVCPFSKTDGFLSDIGMSSILLPVPSKSR